MPWHGVPGGELLSDRGAALLSKLTEEVYWLLNVRKTNTTYHPQTDHLIAHLPTCWPRR